MNLIQRIVNIVIGGIIIAAAIFLMMAPELGYLVITVVLGLSLLITAITSLIYYATMARHMVGGRSTLYSGLIRLDLAVFTLSLSNVPKSFIMIYLVSVYGVTGVLNIARALEARKKGQPTWVWSFINGLFKLALSSSCSFFINNARVVGIIYCIGLIYTGLSRIIMAFYRSKVVYIQ